MPSKQEIYSINPVSKRKEIIRQRLGLAGKLPESVSQALTNLALRTLKPPEK